MNNTEKFVKDMLQYEVDVFLEEPDATEEFIKEELGKSKLNLSEKIRNVLTDHIIKQLLPTYFGSDKAIDDFMSDGEFWGDFDELFNVHFTMLKKKTIRELVKGLEEKNND